MKGQITKLVELGTLVMGVAVLGLVMLSYSQVVSAAPKPYVPEKNDPVYGCTPTNLITKKNMIVGTKADEVIDCRNANGPVVMKGRGGNDDLLGSQHTAEVPRKGDGDTIYGGKGNDRIWGMGGNDTIYGNSHDDKIDGGKGVFDHCDGGRRSETRGDTLYKPSCENAINFENVLVGSLPEP